MKSKPENWGMMFRRMGNVMREWQKFCRNNKNLTDKDKFIVLLSIGNYFEEEMRKL